MKSILQNTVLTRWVAGCSLALLGPLACGSSAGAPGAGATMAGTSNAATGTGTAATSAGAGGGTSTGQTSGAGGLSLSTAGAGGAAAAGGSGSGVGGGCAATFVQAMGQKLAMFIMLDQSRSMNQIVDQATMTTRWGAVTGAIASFVNNPATAGIPVGLQYFGLAPSGSMNSSCVVGDYAMADVPIAPLPGNATPITTSMTGHAPSTNTPTLPAVEGGIQFVVSYATAHPDYKVVLVLTTDGEPNGCNSTLQNVSAAAAAGLAGSPSVQTYVIGVGSSLTNLNAIAAAGGTTQAFLVSDATAQQDLVTALTAIQSTVLPCQYPLPTPATGQSLDFGKVNVQYTPGGGTSQDLKKVATAADCPATGNFWYYDNNAAPTQILLCGDTCTTVTADTMGKVNIVLDCKPTING